MRQRGQRIAADNELESKKPAKAKLAKEVTRLTHMHEPCLHPTFEPACALAKPGTDFGRRLFIGGGIDHAGSIAKAGEPHTEIGILCDVVRVPATDFAQRRGPEVGR